MDVTSKKERLINGIKKYKFSILILLLGFILMVLPSNMNRTQQKTDNQITERIESTLEQKLSAALSRMHGAGNVEVILTKSAGEEVIYQTDQDSNESEASKQTKFNTITITDADRNQSGLIRQVNPERYQGAIILCQGADDPAICLSLVDAVSKATGLGANKISVLRMK